MSGSGITSLATHTKRSSPGWLRSTFAWRIARGVRNRLARALGLTPVRATAQPALARPTPKKAVAKPAPKPVAKPAAPAATTLYGLGKSHARALANKLAALHIGDGAGAEFHVDLWLQHMQQSNREILVIVRSAFVFAALKKRNDLDVVYVKEARDGEVLLARCPKLKAMFYTSNTGNTIHFIRNTHLVHVFLGHGDSEKSASCHKFFRVYDEIWTAGQAHIDRFRNSGIDFRGLALVPVGRPSLTPILKESTDAVFGNFLYLPTWEGFYNEQLYSSVAIGIQFLRYISLATGKRPVVKFHPWTGKQTATLLNSETNYRRDLPGDAVAIAERSAPVVSVMRNVDFLIADISSVVTDFLPTQRPIFLYAPQNSGVRVASSSMVYSEYCYEFADLDSLSRLIDQVIVAGDDYLKDNRRKALEYFIDVDATLKNAFERELDRVIAA